MQINTILDAQGSSWSWLKVEVLSDPNSNKAPASDKMVIVRINDLEATVNGLELKQAVENAMNN